MTATNATLHAIDSLISYVINCETTDNYQEIVVDYETILDIGHHIIGDYIYLLYSAIIAIANET